MNIALYFGSFNPIHIGHLGLAKEVLKLDYVDELWLVVTPNNPLKNASILISDSLRLEMTALSSSVDSRIKVCDVELSLPKPNYTINTLNYLSNKFPQHNFILIIGGDNMEIFDKWKNWDLILQKWRVLVYPRDNAQILLEKFQNMTLLQHVPLFSISSSEIRNKIAQNESFEDLVSDKVYKFIIENNLYKNIK